MTDGVLQSPCESVVFRAPPADHPNSFTVPVSINLSQVLAHDAQARARLVFRKPMRAIADATAPLDTDEAAARNAAPASSGSAARLGPGGDPAESKR